MTVLLFTLLLFCGALVAGFLARTVEQESIEMLVSTPVRELLHDDEGAVVGVRADGPDGVVERHGPVVLATSTYDWDPELAYEFLGLHEDDFGSMAPASSWRGASVQRPNGFQPRAYRWFRGGASPMGSPTDPSTPCRTR